MKIFKKKSVLRDQILMALHSGNFKRATALMVSINYAIMLLRRKKVKTKINPEYGKKISRKILRELEKLNLRERDLKACINIKYKNYMQERTMIYGLLEEDLNSYNMKNKSILFSTIEYRGIAYRFKRREIADWFIRLHYKKIRGGLDLFFNEFQKNMYNEIFQYKLYMEENSLFRYFILGHNNRNLIMTTHKNDKQQSLLHMSAIKSDFDTFLECLIYLSLDPNEMDADGYSAMDYISDLEFYKAIQKYLNDVISY